MAGDWLKMTHALPEKAEVLAISTRTALSRFDVVGRLFIMWRWFDLNTVDGNAAGVTSVTLNACLFGYGDVTEFVTAVVSAGWLTESEAGLSVVKFDEHTSESAKQRAQTAKRVAKSKTGARGNANVTTKVTLTALPKALPVALPREDNREEVKEKNTSAPARPNKRPLPDDFAISDRVKAWAAERGVGRLTEHLESFRAKCAAKDYRYVDWDAAFMEAIRGDWAKLGAVAANEPVRRRHKELTR